MKIKNIKNILVYIFIYIFIVGCESNSFEPEFTFLDVYLNDEKDENNYYHIDYIGTPYHSVQYNTIPNERVFWGSPNDFDVDWMGQTFIEPVINYSTYADDLGNGQQMFYINDDMVGDTLVIYGYVNQLIWDSVFIIIED